MTRQHEREKSTLSTPNLTGIQPPSHAFTPVPHNQHSYSVAMNSDSAPPFPAYTITANATANAAWIDVSNQMDFGLTFLSMVITQTLGKGCRIIKLVLLSASRRTVTSCLKHPLLYCVWAYSLRVMRAFGDHMKDQFLTPFCDGLIRQL